MKKEYKFSSLQSGTVYVIVDNDKITIRRKGIIAFANHGLKGDKTLMINQISAVQLKKAGMTIGYLQLCLIGSQESKHGLQGAMKDENTIAFGGGFNDKKSNQDAQEIKDYIENFNSSASNIHDNNTTKLADLKNLLDSKAITEEEYKKLKQKTINEMMK